MAERRTKLTTAGGIGLAAVVALGAIVASVSVFGLDDDPSRVGKLSPIDTTESTTVTTPAADDHGDGAGASTTTTPSTAPNAAPSATAPPPTTTVTAPGVDDHGGSGGHDNSGSGSSHSGRDHDDD